MKKHHYLIGLAIAAPLGAVAFWLWSNSRAATRTSPYTLVRTDGGVEFRDYPHLTVADAPMSATGSDDSFRKLFRYITGGNARSEKIAMTTPVLIGAGAGRKSMRFIMPETVADGNLPQPLDNAVSIQEVNASRVAVMRFPGSRTPANEDRAVHHLEQWLSEHDLHGEGQPMIAYYDPPWIPTFLRRNEVMIPVAE